MTGTWFEQTRDYSPTIETIDVLHQIWKKYGQWCKRRFFKNWQEQNVNFGWIFPDFLFFLITNIESTLSEWPSIQTFCIEKDSYMGAI